MRLTSLIMMISTLLLAACSAPTLQTEIIPNADMDVADFKTYTWADNPLTLIGVLAGASSTDLEFRVKKAVSKGMSDKGYQFVSPDEPYDISVSFLVGAVNETQYSAHNFTKDRWAYNATFVWTQSNDYLKGALSVVMRQPTVEDDILWQGTAAENLNNKSTKNKGTVDKFASIILAELPPSRIK